MKPIGDISLAYLSGDYAAIPRLMNAQIALNKPISQVIYEVYGELKGYSKGPEAVTFVVSCNASLNLNNADLLAILDQIYRKDGDDSCVDLYLHYVNAGGTDPAAFETAIFLLGSRSDHLAVITFYEKAKALGIDASLQLNVRYNVGQAYFALGRYQAAALLFRDIQRERPNHLQSAKFLYILATAHKSQEAISFLQDPASFPTQALAHLDRRGRRPAPWVVSWREGCQDEVVESIAQNGFCVLKGGCAKPYVARLFNIISISPNLTFPTPLTTFGVIDVLPLFTFDVAALMSEILGKPATVNQEISCARRVNPERADSFTPFHQDMTAFMEFTANIWAPLTPAGGDFPSLELIRKRISAREQVTFSAGDYNLIEIDAAAIAEAYPDLLYEVEQAEPGDCVIFLGSTIHRSSNLAKATKTRFNLELRWS